MSKKATVPIGPHVGMEEGSAPTFPASAADRHLTRARIDSSTVSRIHTLCVLMGNKGPG